MSDKLELNGKKESVKTDITVRKSGEGFNVFIAETIDGKAQPVRFGTLKVIGDGSEKSFMTIRAPIRAKDADGQFITKVREKNGKFINEKGKEVEKEVDAAREYVSITHKNDESKQVWGQIATLYVSNVKSNGEPTKSTYLSIKQYSDDEALAIERLQLKLSGLEKESAEFESVNQKIKDLRASTGAYENFFIKGSPELLESLGYEVRLPAKREAASPQP